MAKRKKNRAAKRKAQPKRAKKVKKAKAKAPAKKEAPHRANAPVKVEKTQKRRWISGGIAAFAILAIIGFVINGAILAPVWSSMETAGVLREGGGGTTALIVYAVLILVVGLILSGIVSAKSIKTAGHAALIGLLVGIILTVFEFVVFLFYRTPTIVPVLSSVGHIVGFALAAWVAWRISN